MIGPFPPAEQRSQVNDCRDERQPAAGPALESPVGPHPAVRRIAEVIVWLIVPSIAFFLLTACDSTQDDVSSTDFVATEEFSHEMVVDEESEFRLKGINGLITITSSETASSVFVEGEMRVGSYSNQDARDFLQRMKVEISSDGQKIIARTDQPDDARGRECTVDFEVTVPGHLDVDVDHVNGTIRLVDLETNASIYLVNGAIDANVRLKPDGVLEFDLVNGTIDLRIPIGTSAEFSAAVINGRVRTSNLQFSGIRSGGTYFTGTLGDGSGRIDLKIVNGNILVSGVTN